MTQTNDPSGSNAPGFGAFIGSNDKDTSGTKTPGNDKSNAAGTSETKGRATKKAATRRGGRRKKATTRSSEASETRSSEASEAPVASEETPRAENSEPRTQTSEKEAPRRKARRSSTRSSSSSRRSASDSSASGNEDRDESTASSGYSEADGGSSSESGADGDDRNSRRRGRGSRGGRRRGAGSSEREAESSEREAESSGRRSDPRDEAGFDEPRGEVQEAKAPRARRSRAAKTDESSGADARDESTPDDEDSGKPRRKRTRGGRGRSRKKVADVNETDQDESAQGSSSDDDADFEDGSVRRTKTRRRSRGGRSRSRTEDESVEQTEAREDDSDESESGEPKRRRRGSRGGRGKTKKVVSGRDKPGAAVVEFIPGEEDDLPALPELPDDAELMDLPDSGTSKSATRKRGRRKRSGDDESEDDDEPRISRKKIDVVPDRKILVNACDSEETRVAVVREGLIMDFQMNVASDTSLVNDIYRGRIVNIEASIGAAFVDFGRGRNGFLHTSDVLPTYADKSVTLSQLLSTSVDPEDWDENSSQPAVGAALAGNDSVDEEGASSSDEDESEGKGGKGRRRSSKKKTKAKAKGRPEKGRQKRFRARPRRPISELFKVGQKVVVQITKDAIGDKGPTLTTYLSIPGRYLVLMPSISHRGVSRKIEDSKERKRLKRILDGMTVPDGMGVIARTATQGHTKAEIKRDLDYLLSAWKKLSKGLEHGHGPAPLYQESDAAIRTVRDLFGPETESVIVDDAEAYKNIREFAELLMPEQAHRIVEYSGNRPLFHAEGVEQDFEKIFSRRIELPSGGSIVFDQAEALVAIDVNSGKTRTSSHDFEEIALKTNMEAVPEIARQIRLRDLGGIIVCDFIDMMKNSNRRTVEQTFRAQFATDRARSKMGRISQFGILEMTRQRLGPGMSKKLFKPCVTCRGAGRQRTESSKAAAILRRLGSALTLKGFTKVEVRAHPETIEFLETVRSEEIRALEESSGRTLELQSVPDQTEDSVLRYLRTDGREVRPGGRRKR